MHNAASCDVSTAHSCGCSSQAFQTWVPYSTSSQAIIEVAQLKSKLAEARVSGGTATHLDQLKDLPLRSKAMLLCKVWVEEGDAKPLYPSRPPTEQLRGVPQPWMDLESYVIPHPEDVMPAFLVHFS